MDKMNRLGFFLIVVMVFILSYCPSSQSDSNLVANDVRSSSKRLVLVDNYAFIEGRWKRTEGASKLMRMATINTVSITCDKMSMTCRDNSTISDLKRRTTGR